MKGEHYARWETLRFLFVALACVKSKKDTVKCYENFVRNPGGELPNRRLRLTEE